MESNQQKQQKIIFSTQNLSDAKISKQASSGHKNKASTVKVIPTSPQQKNANLYMPNEQPIKGVESPFKRPKSTYSESKSSPVLIQKITSASSKSSIKKKQEEKQINLKPDHVNKDILTQQKKKEILEAVYQTFSIGGHYDDSSDEEDIFLDSDLETIKRNSQNKYSQGSELQNAFILELEGRRVLYHNKIRRKYLNLKHQLFGNQCQFYAKSVQSLFFNVLNSLEFAANKLIEHQKHIIVDVLFEDPQEFYSELSTILMDVLFEETLTNKRSVLKDIRKLTRYSDTYIAELISRHQESADKSNYKFSRTENPKVPPPIQKSDPGYKISEKKEEDVFPKWLASSCNRAITQYLNNFKFTLEQKAHKFIEDKKFQLDLIAYQLQKIQSSIKNVPEELKEVQTPTKQALNQISPHKTKIINEAVWSNFGELCVLTKGVESFLQGFTSQLHPQRDIQSFINDNKYLFSTEELKKIFNNTLNLQFKSELYQHLHDIFNEMNRPILKKTFTNNQQKIANSVDHFSFNMLLYRSSTHQSMYHPIEIVRCLLFQDFSNSKEELAVQKLQKIHLKGQMGQRGALQERVVDLGASLPEIFEDIKSLQLPDTMTAHLIRLVFRGDTSQADPQVLTSLTPIQRQIIVNLVEFFFGINTFKSPAFYIILNMCLDLVLHQKCTFENILLGTPLQNIKKNNFNEVAAIILPTDIQNSSWLSALTNTFSPRKHFYGHQPSSNKPTPKEITHYLKSLNSIVHYWVQLQSEIQPRPHSGIQPQEQLRLLIKTRSLDWNGFNAYAN